MVDEFEHSYDAAKRREYYLKNRHLKGRKKAAPKPPAKTRAQRQAERRKKQEAQIAALKGRLEKLRELLAAETKKAKARSGVKPSKTAAKKTVHKSASSKKKQTAAQKAKAAKAAKEYREKNKDQLLADEVKSLTDKIKKIQERIAKMRKTGSIGANRNSTK